MNKYVKIVGLAAVVSFGLAACDQVNSKPTAISETQSTENNQQRLVTLFPVPQVKTSIERQQLIKRANRINVQNMTGCVYLIAQSGQIVSFYPVNGKISSLNSYLTGETQPIADPHGDFAHPGSLLMESPDVDGTYGKNVDGIFFFTADTDAYVEWKGDYLWSDQCLKPAQEPLLTRQVTGK